MRNLVSFVVILGLLVGLYLFSGSSDGAGGFVSRYTECTSCKGVWKLYPWEFGTLEKCPYCMAYIEWKVPGDEGYEFLRIRYEGLRWKYASRGIIVP